MKIYVLEVGCYEQAYIAGVYATPEAAMAAHQPEKKPSNVGPYAGQQRREHTYTWGERHEFGWSFDADWDDAAHISEYEVES